jgi:hypothetical protein
MGTRPLLYPLVPLI